MTAWQVVNLILSIEHGWFCVRLADEHLLWSKKLEELPPKGFTLESIADELDKAMKLHEADKKVSQG